MNVSVGSRGGHEASPYRIYLMFKKNHTIQLKKSACDETSEMSPGVQSAVDGVASDGSDEIGWLIVDWSDRTKMKVKVKGRRAAAGGKKRRGGEKPIQSGDRDRQALSTVVDLLLVD